MAYPVHFDAIEEKCYEMNHLFLKHLITQGLLILTYDPIYFLTRVTEQHSYARLQSYIQMAFADKDIPKDKLFFNKYISSIR
uniref:Uncharacterized protein n=1 Tax=Faxonius propinquus nudivirus TaxID=3139431 RepID=A0AAU8GC39_9VIRU